MERSDSMGETGPERKKGPSRAPDKSTQELRGDSVSSGHLLNLREGPQAGQAP